MLYSLSSKIQTSSADKAWTHIFFVASISTAYWELGQQLQSIVLMQKMPYFLSEKIFANI